MNQMRQTETDTIDVVTFLKKEDQKKDVKVNQIDGGQAVLWWSDNLSLYVCQPQRMSACLTPMLLFELRK